MNKSPLLSIIVPTKNRHKYLTYFIDFFCAIKTEELELVIQDNSDDNSQTTEFLDNIKDERIKYFYTPHSIPISENSDKAILNSTGKYICYMGDDDLFAPNILEAVSIMQKYHAEVALFTIPVFVWPDCKGTKIWDISTPYRIPKATGKIRVLDSLEEMKKIFKAGASPLGYLPKVYHAIATRECLDRVYEQYSSYFPGSSPDMANAVALALNNVKTIHVDYPFLIGGTGMTRITGNEKGDNQKDMTKLRFLPANIEQIWDKRIPKVWAGETIHPQTALEVLKKAGQIDYSKYINFNLLYFKFVTHHPQDRKYIYTLLSPMQYPSFLYYSLKFTCKYIANRIARKLSGKRLVITEEVPDIVAYTKIVLEYNKDVIVR